MAATDLMPTVAETAAFDRSVRREDVVSVTIHNSEHQSYVAQLTVEQATALRDALTAHLATVA